ncbi:DUF2946 domain-containing protein [Dickeya sp. CFBP 2040]|uniref:DUF2946 family protein n=1 Tax=Dickeya sp. CFBP 2040 TaxID=2718531 RepID=UPI001446F81B|nr:DUF2946 family protein [Dickeya sp. CFBP 2040]NKI74598.1 DUF2946 domain-containing protein [Dickeya sp. CFBP 2040]
MKTAEDKEKMGMDHAACGYCVLLSYLSLLALSGWLQPVPTAWLPRWLSMYSIFTLLYTPHFLSPLPRAPPHQQAFVH